MKKLLLLLLLTPLFVMGQDEDPCYSINDILSDHEVDNKPISYPLSQGWNMVGYYGSGYNNEMSVQINEETLSNGSTLEETFQVIKNVSGQFWSPDYSQLNTLTPGEGYMMYVISNNPPAISFSAQFEMPQISGCTNCFADNFNHWASIDDGSCLRMGCTNMLAINYDILATQDDGSCLIEGCNDNTACNFDPIVNIANNSCEYPQGGYDCDGDVIILEIGGEAFGGIVFYIDGSGNHGLVAANNDITDGAYSNSSGGNSGFAWGCSDGNDISGAEGTVIGTGYQNTLDIVNWSESQDCSPMYGPETAADKCSEYTYESYNDWYLPSKDALLLMYNNIGPGADIGNVGLFTEGKSYWSSSEGDVNNNTAWSVIYYSFTGIASDTGKNNPNQVRPIRSF